MRTAILSDIHSNLEALTACIKHAERHQVERFVTLGDYIGYGPDPCRTLDQVAALPGLLAVRGNHDDAITKAMSSGVSQGIRDAGEWTQQQLQERHLEFINKLPYLIEDPCGVFVHATAVAEADWTYIRMDDQALACMEASPGQLTFIGHVHVPMVFYETPNGTVRDLRPHPRMAIPITGQGRYVINVGSVGQPRDFNNAACYVIYDDELSQITFYRVPYDFFLTAEKIRSAKLDPFFAERLTVGR
ncbi:MAG: metallophosphoesterase family protein [Gammaproteobacteria bacterium]|nr:MAG: metallophosphoesterase family protein [Gammaproteobacteria bacterium]